MLAQADAAPNAQLQDPPAPASRPPEGRKAETVPEPEGREAEWSRRLSEMKAERRERAERREDHEAEREACPDCGADAASCTPPPARRCGRRTKCANCGIESDLLADIGGLIRYAGKPYCREWCERAVKYVAEHPDLAEDVAALILKGSFRLGMTEEQVRASVGEPDRQSRFVSAHAVVKHAWYEILGKDYCLSYRDNILENWTEH